MYAPLSRVLIRAPLLPVRDLRRGARALAGHRLGRDAIALASPSLAAAKPGAARNQALDRYARRAAFRPTPSGLLSGVCVGTLGARADVATGTPAAALAPSWSRMNALARALLQDPDVQDRVRLRRAPSVLRAPDLVWWIGAAESSDTFYPANELELTERLAAVLEAAAEWTPWPDLREPAAPRGDEPDSADELLLDLIDFGLLQSDLRPPLVGRPAHVFLTDRLASLGLDEERASLEAAVSALATGDLSSGEAALDRLPGRARRAVHAVLVHRPPRPPRIPRAPVVRAARLVPLLLRLQEALAPPAAERPASSALADTLDACTELYGAGAFDLEALATGAYGLAIDGDEGGPTGAADPTVVAFLGEAFADAAREGSPEVALEAAALERALADVSGTPLPDTAELFLVPRTPVSGRRPGDGWLLGLHGPAGASLGRFAHALGPALTGALAELAAGERQAGAGERLDVAFSPSADLTDLCAHPPVRGRALAISGWSEGEDLTLSELALAADPARPDALSLRPRARGGDPLVPSPLARVRSATAPAGVARLAVGWTLQRQHAPWAFTPGPLAALDKLPRVALDGFVIAPASWRVPPELREGRGGRTRLLRWRRAAGVPRHVQVGEGDELLPVDLEAPAAARELAGQERVHEIWPPLDTTIDRDGRRLELVVPVVRRADPTPALPDLGRVPPPREAPPLPGWRTFKLFGHADRQAPLLLHAVWPAIDASRAAGEIDGWFFLRYLDGPGRRHHLRVRVHAPDGTPAAFEHRLRAALAEARAASALTSLETAEYFPERGRFQDQELAGLHEIFEADSEATLAFLDESETENADAHPAVERVRLFDAIAAGFGLDAAGREAVAAERRAAAESSTGAGTEERREADADFRAQARTLRAALRGEPAEPLRRLRARVAGAVVGWPSARRALLLPTVLHLSSVRLGGPNPDAERLGYTFWQRAREGLRRAPA
ncbi:MAG TPA: thiopeptide-type bacteriocin biosynthesis protein [Polyangia bacterium]|nr:thiopeptide-type bacteriocin biosynthesis protein [Polyangia bacterium]